jgi:hypothetical protein
MRRSNTGNILMDRYQKWPVVALLVCGVLVFLPLAAAGEKNWSAPSFKPFVQTLTEQVIRAHPELISVTFHGSPPDAPPKTFTMFGGSYLDRIGNPDDPDDVMVIETGITILDPRWHRTKDAIRKFVVMTPLRDAAGENIGLLVLAYKNPADHQRSDASFYLAGTQLRDKLQRQIPSFAALFAPAK